MNGPKSQISREHFDIWHLDDSCNQGLREHTICKHFGSRWQQFACRLWHRGLRFIYPALCLESSSAVTTKSWPLVTLVGLACREKDAQPAKSWGLYSILVYRMHICHASCICQLFSGFSGIGRDRLPGRLQRKSPQHHKQRFHSTRDPKQCGGVKQEQIRRNTIGSEAAGTFFPSQERTLRLLTRVSHHGPQRTFHIISQDRQRRTCKGVWPDFHTRTS